MNSPPKNASSKPIGNAGTSASSPALFAEFDRRLHEGAAATYGDLIGETTRHLRAHPEIVARLRERWRYVMLDESQDSSDLQLAFLETIVGGPGDTDAAGMMPVRGRSTSGKVSRAECSSPIHPCSIRRCLTVKPESAKELHL